LERLFAGRASSRCFVEVAGRPLEPLQAPADPGQAAGLARA
jgi:hypothetical protein